VFACQSFRAVHVELFATVSLVSRSRRVLFFRDFQGFTGGHLKVWDYFHHLACLGRYHPQIYFTPRSQLDCGNPWVANQVPVLKTWKAMPGDIVFLAGLDWTMLPDPQSLEDSRASIVNLIQHVRHADPGDPRFEFLRRHATRICVSEEVSTAICATGIVNGPVHTVRAATDVESYVEPNPTAQRGLRLLIAGNKNPNFAERLSNMLREGGVEHRLLTDTLSRDVYLGAIRSSSAVVLLPHVSEGFYLPALEAMALRTLVICPDCIGNRGHCLDGVNCFRPEYTLEAVIEAIANLNELSEVWRVAMLDAATATAGQHSLAIERAHVCHIFDHLTATSTSTQNI
jgi:Glycosyl transferases group 1